LFQSKAEKGQYKMADAKPKALLGSTKLWPLSRQNGSEIDFDIAWPFLPKCEKSTV